MTEAQTDRYTDTQTAVTDLRFALATPHKKCNKGSGNLKKKNKFIVFTEKISQLCGNCKVTSNTYLYLNLVCLSDTTIRICSNVCVGLFFSVTYDIWQKIEVFSNKPFKII